MSLSRPNPTPHDAVQNPARGCAADPKIVRYALKTPFLPLPFPLHYRAGHTLILEIARETAADQIPSWVFRARKLGAYHPDTYHSAPLPTMNLLIAAAPQPVCLTLVFSFYGRKHLEQALREGWHLPENTPQARVMDRLVALGRAARWPAS